jgi:hypothetical protein
LQAPVACHSSNQETVERFASAGGEAELMDDIFEPRMSGAHSGMSDSDDGTSQYAQVDPVFSSDSEQEYSWLFPPNGEFDSSSSSDEKGDDMRMLKI